MTREELLRALEMFAKNWLAHDGCWFLAVEERLGTEAAVDLDARSWALYAAAEARRIMATFDIAPGGGLDALEKALSLRMYSLINSQHVEWADERHRLRFVMDVCRVQETRRRKQLPDFPCKEGRPGRIRNVCALNRSTNSGEVRELSPGSSCWAILRVGLPIRREF